MKTVGYAARDAQGTLSPFEFSRRDELGDHDIAMEILFCGICHSDLHFSRDDWAMTVYPVVPGHEIVGRVTATGAKVAKHREGDTVAIGCMVDSCQHCDQCKMGDEQFCREGMTATYNWSDKLSGGVTYGGFSKHIVAREEFVLTVPQSLDRARAAPLLCAGITVYSPLRRCGVGDGSRVAVVGLGGLGHMAVKIASAMGAHVTVISRSPSKSADASELGANAFLLSTDAAAMELMAPDIVWNEAENFPLADRNPYIGPQAVVEGIFARLGDHIDDFGVEIDRFVASGDGVVMEGRYIGTAKMTGQPINPQIAHVWTVRDGRIAAYQQHVDTLAVARATGSVS